MKRALPIFTIIVGIYWMIQGFNYGLMNGNRVGGGLMPTLCAALAIIFAIWVLVKERKNEEDDPKFDFRVLIPLGALLLVMVVSYAIGMVVALALFILLWMWIYEKYPLHTSVLVAIITVAIIYLIFDFWLNVPLPKGIFKNIF